MYGHTPSLRDAHPIVPCEVHAVIGTRKSRIGGSERQSALGALHPLGTIGARQSIQPSKIKGPDHRLSDPATEIDARTLEDSPGVFGRRLRVDPRSEEHTSELQSLMRISYACFCLKHNI